MSPLLHWPREAILAAIHTWVETHHGHFVTQAAFRPDHGMPSKGVVYGTIGPMVTVKLAYEQQYGSRAGLVQCPRCGERWWSPDRYDELHHSYAQRKAGQCRLPGQPRFSHRRRLRLPTTPGPPRDEEPGLPADSYKTLVCDLLDEALDLLINAQHRQDVA